MIARPGLVHVVTDGKVPLAAFADEDTAKDYVDAMREEGIGDTHRVLVPYVPRSKRRGYASLDERGR